MNNQTTAVVDDRFISTNPCLRGILQLFSDEKTADVVFEVDGEKFYAHWLILRACAPALAEYCGEEDGSGMTSVPVADVEPGIFRHVLYYVYGGNVPDKAFSEHAKDIIDAADRLGVGNLKVDAEGWYVKLTPITLSNFAENLYFSDTKNCALLKEKVMDFLVRHEVEALDYLSKNQGVPQSESMLPDILTALARKQHIRGGDGYDFELKTMSVDALRKELDKRGLGVDGTREMLMSAVEKCYSTEGAIVEGAGTPEVNGFYKRAGTYDGAPKYEKSATYQGGDVEFLLYRSLHYDDGAWDWYISVVPAGSELGDDEIEFYGTVDTEYEMTPPRDGWLCQGPMHGQSPAPKVRVQSSH
mmetsp:Transcript_3585/g.7471  ORF Transcript_3585/g.7471 Transcript_3585/m.7471 type:complete len:358 (+) Transcript_3585:55-1128(+)